MNGKKKICVVIVTYNRKMYLEKLLDRLERISLVSAIYVFDNHSSDGTYDYFSNVFSDNLECMRVYIKAVNDKELFYFRNQVNSGGAGGFHDVVQLAMKHKFDYLWIMDDDVLPSLDCLNNLRNGLDDEHKVVIPDRTDDLYSDTAVIKYSLYNPFKLTMGQRVTRVPCCDLKEPYIDVQAMAFEGPLIDTEIVKKVGYPDKNYFILFDDSDYCRRILQFTRVRLVKSAILHKQIIPTNKKELDWKEYYSYRNGFVFDRKYGKNGFVRHLRPFLIKSFSKWREGKRYGNIARDLISVAYRDALSNNMGKTLQPGKIKEYLYGEGND